MHNFTHYCYPDVTVAAEGSADLPPGFPFMMGYVAVFEKGAIEYNSRRSPTLSLYGEDGSAGTPELPNPLGDVSSGLNIASASGYFLEEAYFLDCIASGAAPAIVTPESARDTVELVRLEMQSARTGARVAVP